MIAKTLRTLALGCMLALAACGESEPDTHIISEDAEANPLLYEIASADGEIEGWMLGTIHALPDGVEWRTPAIERVIDDADLLLVEIADQHNREANAATFQRLATTPGLEPLDQRLPPPFRATVAEIIDRSDFETDDFTSIESWAAAIMLSRVDAVGKPQNGVDRAVISAFDGRTIRGFETTASQLSIFDRLPDGDQRDLLRETLLEYNKSRENPGWLMEAWLTGDDDVLEEASNTGILADPGLRQALLIDRNEDWVAQLEPVLADAPRPLVAVGAAHLVGPDGLPQILKSAGYTVRRIN